ncbi:pilus assembly PilX family protein [Undibacterium sp. Xuan67W]|uniref:pilus assembly PilX family protein n=1 Tax=Undibacterium sp. Xuan67W TaxID=3413057 RepID=UPI003BF43C35
MKPIYQSQRGFVLATSMIFLLIMTILAITAIRRSTLDEKVAGNLREQNLAFQAAERALRYCQNDLETVGTIAVRKLGVTDMPTEWSTKANWQAGGFATTLPAGTVANVITQPQCMIEEWLMRPTPGVPKGSGREGDVYLITARGVGATSGAVVWLQSTIRTGNM